MTNCADCLLVFTRYPEPGRTKTRLIPAVGAQQAARIQRQMTEQTLRQVQAWQAIAPLAVEIQFTGATLAQMQVWLGTHWAYRAQVGADLGTRLQNAIAPHFAQGRDRVLVIGIDCPELSVAILQQAQAALTAADVVLGPAADGGYYLIGLRVWEPDLFTGIAWGRAQVFAQTQSRVQAAGLTLATLPMLRDVDEPEDLPVWLAHAPSHQTQPGE